MCSMISIQPLPSLHQIQIMRILFTVLLASICCLAKAQTITLNIQHQNVTRNSTVYLPSGFNAQNQYPLVFNLHGYTSSAAQQMPYSTMNNVADTAKFIVCYPDGIANAWNPGFTGVYGTGQDDVGFISKLIDTLIALYNVNPNKVYSCGMSMGGYMSSRLACDLENRIAAIAGVTGLIADSAAFYCTLSRKVPAMYIHGTADNVVSYNGFLNSYGVEKTINFWRGKNGCTSISDTVNIPNTSLLDNCTAERISYKTCDEGAEVVLIKITNGGHTWPGGLIDIPSNGNTNRDFNASATIWNFFNRFSLNQSTVVKDDFSASSINVFPNPFHHELKVETADAIESITLFNTIGQVALKADGAQTLNTDFLQQGVYYAVVKTQRGTQQKTVVKL